MSRLCFGSHDVRLRAASLNHRDLSIAWGTCPGRQNEPFIPLSDGAGRVDAAGEGVTEFEEGNRVVTTSSGEETLARAEALRTDETINYECTPDWHEPVLDRTDGTGVDCVVEVGGTGTLGRSFQSVALEGKIGLIGVLTDANQNPNPHLLMRRQGHLDGIYAGGINHPRDSFAAIDAAITTNDIEPVVDRTFALDEVRDAYQHQADQAHVGKVVISIQRSCSDIRGEAALLPAALFCCCYCKETVPHNF